LILLVCTNIFYIFALMSDENHPYCQCLYYSSTALSRMVTKMAEEEFAITGLSPSYAFIMMSLNKADDMTPGELAEIMLLTPSTITRLVEKLERKKLAKRTFEGRNTLISSTEKGKALNNIILKAWNNFYQRYKNILGQEISTDLTEKIYNAVRLFENSKS